MAHSSESHVLKVEEFKPSQNLKTFAIGSVALGVLAFAMALLQAPERAWASYLTALVFVSGISLGGFFFVAVNHIVKAGWSTSIRRLSEGFTSFLPIMLIASLVLVLGVKYLYPWANPEVVAENPLIQAKTAYLNVGFLLVRLFIFGLLMVFFARKIVGHSLIQDQTKNIELTHSNVRWSVIWIPLFAITFSFFSVDLLMSLLPTWYSTIFGIYVFAGSFQASLALLLLVMIYMKNKGFILGYYSVDHVHDVAKYLKGFSIFWAYIAFSQFMLIWYANIPEETEFFLMRAHSGWMPLSFLLLIFKFVIPFLALLPRSFKRNEGHVAAVSILVILTQYLDIYWLVYPNFNDHQVTFGFYEVGILMGFVGLFSLGLLRFYQKHSLVAVGDPRLHEALDHHVSY
jgi:hypothetical protein